MEQTIQKKLTQYDVVLEHLKEGKELSQLEATEKYGILRLGAIVFNLRRDGYDISTRMEHSPNRYGHISNYAVYKLHLKKYRIEWETCHGEDYREQSGVVTVEALDEKEAAEKFDVFHAVITRISEVKE